MGTLRLHVRRSMSVSLVNTSVMGRGLYWVDWTMVSVMSGYQEKKSKTRSERVEGPKREPGCVIGEEVSKSGS